MGLEETALGSCVTLTENCGTLLSRKAFRVVGYLDWAVSVLQGQGSAGREGRNSPSSSGAELLNNFMFVSMG